MRMRSIWLATVLPLFIFAPVVSAQDEYHIYFGNIDESPFPVPAHDTVDIPVYVSGARVGGGIITLYSLNQYISDRLGGNFYLAGQYNFSDPQNLDIAIRQTLNFATSSWGEGIFHLADFTMVMDADSADIGHSVDALSASPVIFSDTIGYNIITPLIHISPLLLEGLNAVDNPIFQPGTFTLFNAYPNPFNSSTTIRFSLPAQSDVAIEFYDISGREVRSFFLPDCQAGENYVVWDGRDDFRSPVSSGTYIYRLIAGKLSKFSRVTLIK